MNRSRLEAFSIFADLGPDELDPVRRLGPGDVFGEIAVLTSGRRTATVVATSPMKVITIFRRDV